MKPLVYSVLPRPAHSTRDGLAIRNYHLLAALSREFRVRAFVLGFHNGAAHRFNGMWKVDPQRKLPR